MDYKYLAKNHISEQQTIIVRDYFETPLETHGNHLDHITHICQYYNISAPLLSEMVSHFKIFDTQTCCNKCNIMRQIYEPTYTIRTKNSIGYAMTVTNLSNSHLTSIFQQNNSIMKTMIVPSKILSVKIIL